MPSKSKQNQGIDDPTMTRFKARMDELLRLAEQAAQTLEGRIETLDPNQRERTKTLLKSISSFMVFLNPKEEAERQKIKSKFADALSREELGWFTSLDIFGFTALKSKAVLDQFMGFLSKNKKGWVIQNEIEYELLSIAFYLIDLIVYLSNENVGTLDLNQERIIDLYDKRVSHGNFIKGRCLLLRNAISPWLAEFIPRHPEYGAQARLVETAHQFLIEAQAIAPGSMDEAKIKDVLGKIERFLDQDKFTSSFPSIIAHLRQNNTTLILTPTRDFLIKIQALREQHARLQEIGQGIQERLAQEQEKERTLDSLMTFIEQYKEAVARLRRIQEGAAAPLAPVLGSEPAPASPSPRERTPASPEPEASLQESLPSSLPQKSKRRLWSRKSTDTSLSGMPTQSDLSNTTLSLRTVRALPSQPASQTPSATPLPPLGTVAVSVPSTPVKVDLTQGTEARLKSAKREVASREEALLKQLQQVESALSADVLLEHIQLEKNLVLEMTSLEKQEEGIKEIMHGVGAIKSRIQIIRGQLNSIADDETQKQIQRDLLAAVQALQLRCNGYQHALEEVTSVLHDVKQKNQQCQIQQKERHALIQRIEGDLHKFEQAGQYKQWWDPWADLFFGWIFTSTRKKYQHYVDHELKPALKLYNDLGGDSLYFNLTRIISLGREQFKKRLSVVTLLAGFNRDLQIFKDKPLSDFGQQEVSPPSVETPETPSSSPSAPLLPVAHSPATRYYNRKVLPPSPSTVGTFAARGGLVPLRVTTPESSAAGAERSDGAALQRPPAYATTL